MSGFFGKKPREQIMSNQKESFALNRWAQLGLAVLITAAMAGVYWFLYPPQFTETNDDVIMSWFAYGYYGEKSAFLCFINIIVGWLIQGLLKLFPTVAWYSILQITLILISLITIDWVALNRFLFGKALLILGLFYLFFGYDFLSSLQFTKTAGITLIAGSLLLFEAGRSTRPLRKHFFSVFLGSLLVLFGSLYRFKVMYLVLGLMFGIGLYKVLNTWVKNRKIRKNELSDANLHSEEIRKNWKRVFVTAAMFIVIAGISYGCSLLDSWMAQNDPGWALFKQYSPYRVAITNLKDTPTAKTGWPSYDDNLELYESLDITYNDYQLFQTANYADERFLNLDNLRTLVAAKSERVYDLDYFKTMGKTLLKGFLAYDVMIPLLIIFGVSFILIILNGNWKALLLVFYEAGVFLAMECYLYIRGRYLQRRVDIVLLAAMFLIMMFYCWRKKVAVKKPVLRWTLIILVMFSCLFLNYKNLKQYRTTKANQAAIAQREAEARTLIAKDQDHFYLYLNHWNTYPDKMFDILELHEEGYYHNTTGAGIWRCTTPIMMNQMASWNLSNPYEDIIDNDSAYLFGATDLAYIEWALTLMKDHYNPNAEKYLIKLVEGKYGVWQISSRSGPDLDQKVLTQKDPSILSSMTGELREEGSVLSGYAYEEGVSSFSSRLYLEITNGYGQKTTYYLTQIRNPECERDNEGRYSAFSFVIPEGIDIQSATLYLETPNGLFQCEELVNPF